MKTEDFSSPSSSSSSSFPLAAPGHTKVRQPRRRMKRLRRPLIKKARRSCGGLRHDKGRHLLCHANNACKVLRARAPPKTHVAAEATAKPEGDLNLVSCICRARTKLLGNAGGWWRGVTPTPPPQPQPPPLGFVATFEYEREEEGFIENCSCRPSHTITPPPPSTEWWSKQLSPGGSSRYASIWRSQEPITDSGWTSNVAAVSASNPTKLVIHGTAWEN